MVVLKALMLLLLAAFVQPSRAVYCICKDEASRQAMQNDIDYACGAGADCSDIQEKGPCFEPNTVRDHCNFAVNSYFQRKGRVEGSCDFAGSATTSEVIPNQAPGCVYQASSNSTSSTPSPPSTYTPSPPSTYTQSPPTSSDSPPSPPGAFDKPATGPTSGATTATFRRGALFVVLLAAAPLVLG